MIKQIKHDGDKVTQAVLDFITDKKVSNKTKSTMFLEYQLKNDLLGKWDETKGKFTEFTGDFINDKGEMVDLTKVKNPLSLIKKTLGISEEQLKMRYKLFKNYNFSVEGRAYKELAKHYGYVYHMMAGLEEFGTDTKVLSNENIDKLESVIKMASNKNYADVVGVNGDVTKRTITLGSKYARENIKNSYEVVDMLRNGITDKKLFKEKIQGMDIISATALFNIAKGDEGTYEEIFNKSHKVADKFLKLGDFDKFYSKKSSMGIFDALTGIRNTGSTHSYATRLRLSGVEVFKINADNLMEKIGTRAGREGLEIKALKEMVRKQEYYIGASDIFYDNMIESAISAKHGLTLGGLEGSKLFINNLLGVHSEKLNNNMVSMFDKIFIKNNKTDLIKFADRLLKFNEEFTKVNKGLETVIDEVAVAKLDKDIFLKSFDHGAEEYISLLTKANVDSKEIKKYLKFKNKYNKEVEKVETKLFNKMASKKGSGLIDFEAFKGLYLFGELMIQNDPNSEYDIGEVKNLIKSYKSKAITYEELLNNHEFRKFKSQTYATLGAAAGISNMANLRGYIQAFQSERADFAYRGEFLNKVSERYRIDMNILEDAFDNKYELKSEELRAKLGAKKVDNIQKMGKEFIAKRIAMGNE
ncbi:hypothetical protein, partial [uncultured Cetobacterium sp.]|uniref:hypothetical protein n=1 Tax=uncultured Cetobacterium sp. TaxID=527638 RepID=UPI002604DB21